MHIKSPFTSHPHISLEYNDTDSFDLLPYEQCGQVYGLCFYQGKLVIGFGGHKHDWGLIGGKIEAGETYRQTLEREVREESNMQVLEALPIGYQKVVDGSKITYQLRYWAKVQPFGAFVNDPDGGITSVKLIDPLTYKQYFDWGKIGDRLVGRAIEIQSRG